MARDGAEYIDTRQLVFVRLAHDFARFNEKPHKTGHFFEPLHLHMEQRKLIFLRPRFPAVCLLMLERRDDIIELSEIKTKGTWKKTFAGKVVLTNRYQ